jgi:hypothetical protein
MRWNVFFIIVLYQGVGVVEGVLGTAVARGVIVGVDVMVGVRVIVGVGFKAP